MHSEDQPQHQESGVRGAAGVSRVPGLLQRLQRLLPSPGGQVMVIIIIIIIIMMDRSCVRQPRVDRTVWNSSLSIYAPNNMLQVPKWIQMTFLKSQSSLKYIFSIFRLKILYHQTTCLTCWKMTIEKLLWKGKGRYIDNMTMHFNVYIMVLILPQTQVTSSRPKHSSRRSEHNHQVRNGGGWSGNNWREKDKTFISEYGKLSILSIIK